MANGNFHVHAADDDTSAGELIPFRPGGLPVPAGPRHGRPFTPRKTRMRIFISAAPGRAEDRIVSALRSR